MIRSRVRIAAKLNRIKKFITHMDARHFADWPRAICKWQAIAQVDRLRRAAKYDPEWKWKGFASELEWARATNEGRGR